LIAAAFVLALTLAPAAAVAVEPGEVLADPALEARARAVGRELRCLVCQNQSIDDSEAPLARDLRVLVRQRLAAGDSDREVVDYVVSRYGDFVLLNPPFKPATYALWLGPAGLVLAALCGALLFYRRRRGGGGGDPAPEPAPLSATERQRLAQRLKDDAS
jgi:cytochrome c-type biogenesis protein CcmH